MGSCFFFKFRNNLEFSHSAYLLFYRLQTALDSFSYQLFLVPVPVISRDMYYKLPLFSCNN